MADGKLTDVLHRMRTLEQVRVLRGQGDGALLERFVATNDEAAFELLVQRHGPMVLGVCRRILADNLDAEDAFQATFLVLARRAASIRTPNAIASWLHAVACQVAGRARKARSQRNRVQVLTGSDIGRTGADEGAAGVEWRELRPVLDEELGRLPEKYRVPVVLCYLEDRSNAEAAAQLGWPVGTVKGRLARARSLLQSRLARRGVALGTALFATARGSQLARGAAVPAALEAVTIRQAIPIATGAAPAVAGATPAVAALYKGGLQAMNMGKVKVAGVLVALLGACVFSGAFAAGALGGHAAGGPGTPGHRDKVPAPREPDKKPAEVGSTEPAGVALAARLVGAKESYPIDRGGLSAEDFKKQLEALAKAPRRPAIGGPRYPASPKVDLKLELTNTGKEEVKVQVRGNANKLTLDLKGPGVAWAPVVIQNFLPVRRPPQVLTIAPGKTIAIADVPTLAFPKPGTGSQAYWTTPGEYTLTVDYVLGVSPAPAKARDVGDGFGEVIVHSAPLKLKVVDAK